MQDIQNSFGGSIEHVFYGVGMWRLQRIDVSVHSYAPGHGGLCHRCCR
jgi:hypothetical protein